MMYVRDRRWRKDLRAAAVGLLLACLLLAPVPTAQAQFVVSDPGNLAIQIERQIEEALRWVDRVNQHTAHMNKMIESVSTLKNVLNQAENLVLHNAKLTRTFASLAKIVQDAYDLKRKIEFLVVTRLQMMQNIKRRLDSGIFDWAADLRDLEDYLRSGIGRSAQAKIATNVRLAKMDNELELMNHNLQVASAKKAGHVKEREALKQAVASERAKTGDQFCGECISTMQLNMTIIDGHVAGLDRAIAELQLKITERVKKYNLSVQEAEEVANMAKGLDDAFAGFNTAKDEYLQKLEAYEQGRIP